MLNIFILTHTTKKIERLKNYEHVTCKYRSRDVVSKINSSIKRESIESKEHEEFGLKWLPMIFVQDLRFIDLAAVSPTQIQKKEKMA